MCGIVGTWKKKDTVQLDLMQKALQSLNHRGPDSSNIWVSYDKLVGLGHARLSIIGLDNGMQPVYNLENKIYAIVNGEFYDYAKIKERYQKSGYKFNTDTDSEIIIPLYLEYGTKMFDKLNGEFAFIIFDEKNQKMICARDRFGIKPLSYVYDKGNFYVASEIKALIALGVKAKWDEYNSSMIFQGVPLLSNSCFENIRQVRPGHFIEICNDKITDNEYWNFSYQDNFQEYSDEEYISLFREKLTQAIERRLVADVPVGFYLSGGIDSSAVLALSAKLKNNIQAFNISFDEKDFDEKGFAQDIANYTGVNLSSIKVTDQDITDSFSNAILHREGFVYQVNGVAKYLLSKHVFNSGYKVVLTGEGSDETLAGYPYFIEDMLNCLNTEERDSLFSKLKSSREKVESAFLSKGNYNHENFKVVKLKLGYMPTVWKMNFDFGSSIKNLYSASFQKKTSNFNPMHLFLEDTPISNISNAHPVNKSAYLFCKSFLPEVVLSYLGDRMEMAHSIEGRLPFLDVELVEFVNKLPINLKIRGLREKYILYEAVKDLVPLNIYQRSKHIFSAPSTNNTSKKSPLKTHIYDVIHSQDFSDLPFFDQTKTIKLFDLMGKMEKRDNMITEASFNLILSAYYLNKHFIK
jgi:asparagine synthase (glutamine-hydrolysing)